MEKDVLSFLVLMYGKEKICTGREEETDRV